MIVFDETLVPEEMRGPLLAWRDVQIAACVAAEREANVRLCREIAFRLRSAVADECADAILARK